MSDHWISTFKRGVFDPFKDNDIEVIATGLSRTGRFAGQGSTFYSVAQHSVLLSKIIDQEFGTHPNNQMMSFCALLHDAPDFFMGDIPTPVREHHKMTVYNVLYEDILLRLLDSFGIKESEELLDIISPYDKRLALTEAKALEIDTSQWNDPQYKVEPYPIGIMPIWTHNHAAEMFLKRFSLAQARSFTVWFRSIDSCTSVL